jgi:hypothetical protein
MSNLKKPIAITLENKDAICEALKAVNGRATSFTITTYSEVEAVAKQAEKALEALPKSDRVGARCSYNPAGPSARAYKHHAKSTTIVIERKRAGWVLILVRETSVHPRENETFQMYVTRAQKDEIARRAVARFAVIATA